MQIEDVKEAILFHLDASVKNSPLGFSIKVYSRRESMEIMLNNWKSRKDHQATVKLVWRVESRVSDRLVCLIEESCLLSKSLRSLFYLTGCNTPDLLQADHVKSIEFMDKHICKS